MRATRFGCYISGGRPRGARRTYLGCRDQSPPRRDCGIHLALELDGPKAVLVDHGAGLGDDLLRREGPSVLVDDSHHTARSGGIDLTGEPSMLWVERTRASVGASIAKSTMSSSTPSVPPRSEHVGSMRTPRRPDRRRLREVSAGHRFGGDEKLPAESVGRVGAAVAGHGRANVGVPAFRVGRCAVIRAGIARSHFLAGSSR